MGQEAEGKAVLGPAVETGRTGIMLHLVAEARNWQNPLDQKLAFLKNGITIFVVPNICSQSLITLTFEFSLGMVLKFPKCLGFFCFSKILFSSNLV